MKRPHSSRLVPEFFRSVLGPLLFTLYVFDLGNAQTLQIYTDDLLIYLHCKPGDIHGGITIVNEEINQILPWARNNKLIFNTNKTNAMLMSSKKYFSLMLIDVLPNI